nr:T9SS type B sorting domain-containing protein [uncultured Allomuricauda sp.]
MQIKWSVAFLFFSWSVTSQVILDNNIGDFVSGPSFFFSPANNWGRTFELQSFGVSQNEELTIDSVEIAFTLGIYSSNPQFFVRSNVYEIDDEFPTSFPEAKLLGSSQTVDLNHLLNFGNGRVHNMTTDLDYPRFFTPNNDGVKDYWRVEGLETFSNATIQIFDRYGKLLKQLGPNDPGWDGTLNGQRLPSNDYWFTLNFQKGRTIKNHFELKR